MVLVCRALLFSYSIYNTLNKYRCVRVKEREQKQTTQQKNNSREKQICMVWIEVPGEIVKAIPRGRWQGGDVTVRRFLVYMQITRKICTPSSAPVPPSHVKTATES